MPFLEWTGLGGIWFVVLQKVLTQASGFELKSALLFHNNAKRLDFSYSLILFGIPA
jgi:hypothetical protein